jgi:hypothetical protein
MMDSTDSVGFTFYTALPAKMRDQASMAMNSSTSTRKNIHTQERTDVVRDVIKPNLIYAGEKRSHSLCNERILNQQYNPYPGSRPCYQNEYLSHSDRGEHFVHVNQNNQSYHGIPDATHRDLYNSEPHLIGKNSPIDFDSPRKRPSSWRSHQQQPLSDDDQTVTSDLVFNNDSSLRDEEGHENILPAKELLSYFFESLDHKARKSAPILGRDVQLTEAPASNDQFYPKAVNDNKNSPPLPSASVNFFGQSMNSLSNKHIENNDFSSIDSSANVKSTPNLNIEYEEKGMRGQLDSTSLNNSENVGSLQEGTLICTILQESDRKLGTNFINAIVDELEVAFFCNRDRKGKRSALPIRFPGLACRHCKGFSKGRKGGRYFHSSIKTMSDSKKSLLAMYHHLLGCERCPYWTKTLIYSLYDDHMKIRKEEDKRHSTQRAFFRRIWAHLHREDCIE